jgi:hypothetical protein
MTPAVHDAIVQAATEQGIDPSFALAVADRESGGDPNAHASKTIYGLFQMRNIERNQYGAGDSADPLTQSRAWMRLYGDIKSGMARRIGRDPTDPEIYIGHYFGPGRAASMVSGRTAPSTPTEDVFTPLEMAENRNFGRAGTVGNLTSGIQADIGRRQAKYAGTPPVAAAIPSQSTVPRGQRTDNLVDYAAFGRAPVSEASEPVGEPIDYAAFGRAPEDASVTPTRPGTEIDLAQFGAAA